jgi:hypothetical protein
MAFGARKELWLQADTCKSIEEKINVIELFYKKGYCNCSNNSDTTENNYVHHYVIVKILTFVNFAHD